MKPKVDFKLAEEEREPLLKYQLPEELIQGMVDLEEALQKAQMEFYWEQCMVMMWNTATEAQRGAIRFYLNAGYNVMPQDAEGRIFCYPRGDGEKRLEYQITENGDLEPLSILPL